MIAYPQYMGIQDWADSLTLDLPNVAVPKFMGDWKEWAITLIRNNQNLERFNIPLPYSYDDWKKWAQEFIRTVEQ